MKDNDKELDFLELARDLAGQVEEEIGKEEKSEEDIFDFTLDLEDIFTDETKESDNKDETWKKDQDKKDEVDSKESEEVAKSDNLQDSDSHDVLNEGEKQNEQDKSDDVDGLKTTDNLSDGDNPDNPDDPDDESEDSDNDGKDKKKKKLPTWAKGAIIAFIVTCVLSIPVFIVLHHLGKINYTNFSETQEQEEEFEFVETADPEKESIKIDEVDWSNAISGSTRYDENVVNILLVGEEGSSKKGYRGNSDTMIIVTIDKKNKTVKMTSIMRDLYLQIPDHKDNKINSSYQTGGIPLLKQTIEENFKVAIDYSVVVQFDTFAKVIDSLGGIDVELNAKEAQFINQKCKTTDSNLIEGKQHLNGEQTMWFSRIRKIKSDIYGSDDFGRTCRQRTVLTTVFNKYKDLSYDELIKVVDNVLPHITTDLTPETIIKCAALVLSYKVKEIDALRIPMDNCFKAVNLVNEATGRSMSVLIMDEFTTKNVDEMHQFIYGDLMY